METILSYIIPAYNAGQFLDKCLNSIAAQNLSPDSYEVILVNDGSTDNSEDIIKSWKSQHPTVNLIYHFQKNKGHGAARNVGIKKATGRYLWFIDSDDYLDADTAPLLLEELVRNDLDAIWLNHRLVNTNGDVLPQPATDVKTDFNADVMSGEEFLEKVFNTSCMPVMFIFKKDILTKNNLEFKDQIYFEDIVFTPKLIYYSKRIRFIDIVAYNYVIHGNSIMRSKDKLSKRICDSLIVVKDLLDFSEEKNSIALTKYLEKFTSEILMYNYRLAISQNDPAFLRDFKKIMKDFGLFPFKIKEPVQIAFISKIANFSPFLFEKLSYLRPIN